MSDLKLPPKPDPDTGLPKPPAGPLDNSWGSSHRRPTDRSTSPPASPEGQGRAIEWITRTWKGAYQVTATYLVLLFGLFSLKYWGIGWTTDWVLWLVIAVLCGIGTLISGATIAQEAGADWFRYGKSSWVKTYELNEVKLDKAWGADRLELKDTDGREVSIKIINIQDNPDLWNLVYNGILHSVHYGGATANERARTRLHLDLEARMPSGDDPA
jgi:hypothetical protein